MKEERIYIYGKHVFIEALKHIPQAIEEVMFATGMNDEDTRRYAREAGIPVGKLGTVLPAGVDCEAVHQGVIARVNVSRLMRPYREFADGCSVNRNTVLVLLGEIHDPQNVGAIIRSAAAFGAQGILVPEHHQAQVTGNVVKVSAGMAFRVPLVAVSNVNTTLRDLKERGFWIYGLAGDAEQGIAEESFDAPTVFIFGNESKGIRAKTRELCDILLSIPLNSRCESLNVATSAAIALYVWSTKHPAVVAKKGSLNIS